MNPAIHRMLKRYPQSTLDESVQAVREILQQLVLLGLWRSKFFEHAAFYGGTALRLLHGLDQFSEDLDFSLLNPKRDFSLRAYGDALQNELEGFGFTVEFKAKERTGLSPIESAFLKANTLHHLMITNVDRTLLQGVPSDQKLKIRIEIDVDPPGGFETESQVILHPIPFAVRTYRLPDLFAGKMHAVLCRKWKRRVKGRDWYDLIWYIANYPTLHLAHLEQRMRQSGHYTQPEKLSPEIFRIMLGQAIDKLPVDQARNEVAPFVLDPAGLSIWSAEFFSSLVDRIEFV